MSTYSLKTRSFVSTWFSLIFFILLTLYLGFIEFFQDSRIEISAKNLLTNPVQSDFLEKVHVIRFKNRLGQFALKKEQSDWILYEPRTIPAKSDTVNAILKELEKLKIQTIHEFEQINIKSFSLDSPVIEIDLNTKQMNQLNIKFGIFNRIDETSYMTVSGHNMIFQTEILKNSLESLELSDFIDSNVFSINANEITRVSIYHGKSNDPYNVLEFKNDNWLSKRYKTISNENTFKTLSKLLNIKSHMIVDKTNDELKSFINNYLASPLYRIVIQTKNGRTLNYKVSTLTKAINELKIEKRQYFIMSASNRPYPFLISKTFLDRFLIRYNNLRR